MDWFKKEKKGKGDDSSNVAVAEVKEVPEVVLTPSQNRVQITFGDSTPTFDEDPRIECGNVTEDKALAFFNGGSSLPTGFNEVVTLQPIDPAEYVQKWATVLNGHEWNNPDLKKLADDAFVGLMGALRSGMEGQVPMQVSCLTRTIARDTLKKMGLDVKEVRFANAYSGWSTHWSNIHKTREQLSKSFSKESRELYLIDGPGNDKQGLVLHDITGSGVRISGRAFLAIEALKRFPIEIIEDVWIAELREVDVVDPLFIIQIGGHSYSICEWDE